MTEKEYILQNVNNVEAYLADHPITEDILEAYIALSEEGIAKCGDVQFGLKISKKAKRTIENFTIQQTGMSLWELEKFSFEHKTWFEMLDKNYDLLKLEAQNKVFDSYLLYLEKKREPRERFYMPKRKQFHKFEIIESYQGLIEDKYDILCISMPPGTSKTTCLKFFNSAVVGWFPKDYNLFYSHSGDITRMYYDGVLQIVTDNIEYAWHDIFPDLAVTSTNAKMQQFNIGSYKPFPSLQTAAVGSENAGKVRASKFLLVDDMIGKLEEALNKNILEKLWGAYTVDARQRKTMDTTNNPCKEVIQATRWSTMDTIGRIKRMYEGNERVKVIAIPDIDPVTGESNFDYEFGGFTVDFFHDQALLMDEISYKCLYKQEPIEREGLVFPEDKIRRYLNLPHGAPEIITAQCDTKGKGTDYFVLPVLAKYGDDYYCIDCVCDNTADYELQYENASNVLANNEVQECEFERNAGGDRVAMEVNKRVESKGWVCNITDVPTETNKEARIYQFSAWILQHVIFKDKSLYTAKEPYGIMMNLLMQYSVSSAKQLDDVPDVFSNFAKRIVKGSRTAKAEAVMNPFRTGGWF